MMKVAAFLGIVWVGTTIVLAGVCMWMAKREKPAKKLIHASKLLDSERAEQRRRRPLHGMPPPNHPDGRRICWIFAPDDEQAIDGLIHASQVKLPWD